MKIIILGSGVIDVTSAYYLARAGLRAMTPDGTPIISATPFSNLFINTGHGTLGWTMACGSAQLLADLMLQRPTALNVEDYSISRYVPSLTGSPISTNNPKSSILL